MISAAFIKVFITHVAFRGSHQATLNSIRNSLKLAKSHGTVQDADNYEQLRIFAHYMLVNRFVTSVEDIPRILLDVSELESSSNQKSRLQQRVIQGVVNAFGASDYAAEYEVLPEASSFAGVFPIDATVKYKGREVAFLEVDGPSHYRYDGKLKRKDRLKEAMYLKRHPHCSFHRIRYDSENKIGADVIGAEIADTIMKSSTRHNIVEGWIKDFGNDMKFILEKTLKWSLRNSPTITR